jgi:hypothetical protein
VISVYYNAFQEMKKKLDTLKDDTQ